MNKEKTKLMKSGDAECLTSSTTGHAGLAADLRSQADRRSPSLRSGERLQADLSVEVIVK